MVEALFGIQKLNHHGTTSATILIQYTMYSCRRVTRLNANLGNQQEKLSSFIKDKFLTQNQEINGSTVWISKNTPCLRKSPSPPPTHHKSTTLYDRFTMYVFFSECFYENTISAASLHAALATVQKCSFRFVIRFGLLNYSFRNVNKY